MLKKGDSAEHISVTEMYAHAAGPHNFLGITYWNGKLRGLPLVLYIQNGQKMSIQNANGFKKTRARQNL